MPPDNSYKSVQILANDEWPYNQPIPVRLIPFLTGWNISQTRTAFTDCDNDCHGCFTVYSYTERETPTRLRWAQSTEPFHALTELSNDELAEFLTAIPPHWFVWSDELIQMFTLIIDCYHDREELENTDTGINWFPEIPTDCTELIEECPNFASLMPLHRPRRGRGRPISPETMQEYTDLLNDFSDAAEEIRSRNTSAIIRRVCDNRNLRHDLHFRSLQSMYYRARRRLDQ